MARLSNWMEDLLNRTTTHTVRIAAEDDEWFLWNGFEKETLDLEGSLGATLHDNLSILCSYDVNGIEAR